MNKLNQYKFVLELIGIFLMGFVTFVGFLLFILSLLQEN